MAARAFSLETEIESNSSHTSQQTQLLPLSIRPSISANLGRIPEKDASQMPFRDFRFLSLSCPRRRESGAVCAVPSVAPQLLGSRKAIRAAGLKFSQVEAKLGWLRKFAPQIRRWREMLAVIEATEHYVRHEGVHSEVATELAAILPQATVPAARSLRKQLLQFVKEEGQRAQEGERLLGSSEVLESIIGKFKYLAGERGPHGMTGMALSIGGLVGSQSVATVQEAMQDVTNQDVWDWCRAHLGSTVQSVRRRTTQALKPDQKRDPLRLETG